VSSLFTHTNAQECVYTTSTVFTSTYRHLGGYTPAVSGIDGKRVDQLRELAGFKTQAALAEAAEMDPSKLSALVNGKKPNLTLRTIERLSSALKVDIRELFESPRPEVSGHADESEHVSGHQMLEALLSTIDQEFPAEDSLEGDIHKAIAALNRALRRPRPSKPVDRPAQKA